MPELIDLGKGEEMPTPSQPKRADHPTMLKLHEKTATTSEKLPAFSFSPLQDYIKTLPAPAPEICPEVPEEQIIYTDDVDPTPLQLLKSQPANATPIRYDPHGTKGSPVTRQRSAFQDAREKKMLPQQY